MNGINNMTYEEHISFYEAIDSHMRNCVKTMAKFGAYVSFDVELRKCLKHLLGSVVYDKVLINDEAIFLVWDYNNDKMVCMNFYTYTLCHGIVIPYYDWVYDGGVIGKDIILYGAEPKDYNRMQPELA